MLIVARMTIGDEFDQRRNLSLAKFGTARMACRHDVAVSGLVLGGCARGMHLPGMDGEHRRQRHFCPRHHRHKQCRRNGFLPHACLASQTRYSRDVIVITPGSDANKRKGYPTRFSRAARNSQKRKEYPLAISFAGSTR